MIEQCRNVIYHVFFSGITTEQQKKTWLINWYFANDPMGSIYLATLRNPALVASYQTSPGMLYGANGATGMETYFIKIKTHFGQSMFDQLVTEFAQQSNLYVDEIKVDEWHIYGCSDALHGVDSKRVARDLNLDNQITSNEYVIETPEEVTYLFSSYQLERGAKRYELANHLGNVLTVISDKKTAVFTGSTFSYFSAERISATDYSPFGAPLAGRTWQASEYRFGFNTQERDDEIAGVGNIMTAQFWEYDSRLGRRWNLDPKPRFGISNYSTFGNNPIWFSDPKGDIFGIGKDDQSQKDIKSLAKSKNKDFIKIGEDGQVGLDFGELSKEKIEEKLSEDKGLALIKNLIEAKDKDGNDEIYYYEASNRREGVVQGKHENGMLPREPGQETGSDDRSFASNFSTTNPGANYVHVLPKPGIDGAVFLSPGTMFIKGLDGSHQVAPRSGLVFHELNENYLRTHFKLEYDEAHEKAGGYGYDHVAFIYK